LSDGFSRVHSDSLEIEAAHYPLRLFNYRKNTEKLSPECELMTRICAKPARACCDGSARFPSDGPNTSDPRGMIVLQMRAAHFFFA
jgi:hypothetical protein